MTLFSYGLPRHDHLFEQHTLGDTLSRKGRRQGPEFCGIWSMAFLAHGLGFPSVAAELIGTMKELTYHFHELTG